MGESTGESRQPESADGYLTGQLLVAMPTMRDPRFAHAVIFICAHNAEGAMGLVINRLNEVVTFPDLLRQLGVEPPGAGRDIKIHFGGPVDAGRGFVLHSGDYRHEGTLQVAGDVALTATLAILKDIASGRGPRRSLLALGYAGWGPGQLDNEIQANGWLCVAPDEELVFGPGLDHKWRSAIAKLGVDVTLLSSEAGHA